MGRQIVLKEGINGTKQLGVERSDIGVNIGNEWEG